jgi:hypothetical protein
MEDTFMNTEDDERKQINLTCEEAEKLAFRSLQDDAESLVLLLEGIKEQDIQEAEMLIISAVNKVFSLTNGYNGLKADYLQTILKKLRQK